MSLDPSLGRWDLTVIVVIGDRPVRGVADELHDKVAGGHRTCAQGNVGSGPYLDILGGVAVQRVAKGGALVLCDPPRELDAVQKPAGTLRQEGAEVVAGLVVVEESHAVIAQRQRGGDSPPGAPFGYERGTDWRQPCYTYRRGARNGPQPQRVGIQPRVVAGPLRHNRGAVQPLGGTLFLHDLGLVCRQRAGAHPSVRGRSVANPDERQPELLQQPLHAGRELLRRAHEIEAPHDIERAVELRLAEVAVPLAHWFLISHHEAVKVAVQQLVRLHVVRKPVVDGAVESAERWLATPHPSRE
mmetsp:Transcript_47540/g.157571  ORF Transcript_47540/g.157571 Transcript_47540/m.157571 type:complete len:300 (-) Transcript_47540:406-1305(-)